MGPIKEICFFPSSVFFFLHLVYFFLMDRKVRTNWSNWRDVQPFFLPRSIFNACCIERSNPLKFFRTFNNFLEAHVNIIWSKRVHLSFCFGYNMHLEFTLKKNILIQNTKRNLSPFLLELHPQIVLYGFSLILFIHPTPLQKERASTDLICVICLCWVIHDMKRGGWVLGSQYQAVP